jgi:hypothetical protein
VTKAYVLDQGYAGAEIYFARNRADAVAYFRDKETLMAQAEISQLEREEKDNLRESPWLKSRRFALEFLQRPDWGSHVQEYPVKVGTSFYTEGE